MLAKGPAADALYREAIERLPRIHTRGCETLARTHLVYGEWLRREGRRVDARAQLRLAHEHYTEMRDGHGLSPIGPVASSSPPARRCANAPWRQSMT